MNNAAFNIVLITTLANSYILSATLTYQEKEKIDSVRNNLQSKKNRAILDSKWGISDNEIKSMIDTDKTFEIEFVGNGNIQQSIDNNENIPVNTGLGLILNKFFYENDSVQTWLGFYRIKVESIINVSSSAESIQLKKETSNGDETVLNQNEFGTSILTPLNSGQAVSFTFKGYRQKGPGIGWISGYRLKYIGSNRNWIFDSDTVQATSNSFRLGIFHELVPVASRKDYSVEINLSFASNWLSNDIAYHSRKKDRLRIINTDATTFWGLEIGFAFELKNIRAEFSYPIFATDDEVPGLSSSRIITSIGFTGGFPLKLNKK